MLGIIVAFVVVVFVVALVSPRFSRKVERKTARKTGYLKQKAHSLWDPLTNLAHKTLDLLKHLTYFSARKGRTVHRKTKDTQQ